MALGLFAGVPEARAVSGAEPAGACPVVEGPRRVIGPDLPGGDRFAGPFGVSVTADGSVLVADDLGHRLYRFGPDLGLRMAVGGQGTRPGQFAWLDAGIELADGTILVADTGNGRLQVLSPTGAPQRVIERSRLLGGRFANPRDVHAAGDGRYLVADWGRNDVQALDSRLRHAATIADEDLLDRPISVTSLPDGRILVSDFGNERVRILDPQGELLASLESPAGARWGPSGLAVAPWGQVLVAAQHLGVLVVYSGTGELRCTLLGRGEAGAPLVKPTDVAIAPDGTTFVVDQGAQRVLVFRLRAP